MENKENKQIELPDNAFRELKPGEEYEPVMSPKRVYPEVTPWSVTWGILIKSGKTKCARFEKRNVQ